MTTNLAEPPFRTSIHCFETEAATFCCASTVLAPRCGVLITSFSFMIADSAGGSVSYTSSAAPATLPLFIASQSASSSIIPPRAQLMIRTPSFIVAIESLLIMCLVSFISGVCTVIKSETRKSSSKDMTSTPSSFARSRLMYGSYVTHFISSALARFAISCPIRPKPTIPRTLSFSSTPINCERFHSPLFTDALACGILRASEKIIASVCSHAARVFPEGAFATITPRFVAASRSILSTPAPALPINFSLSAASITLAVTCVPLLTRSAS